MTRLRHLGGHKGNRSPVLTAARRIMIEALRCHISSRPLGEMAEFVNGTSYRSHLLAEEGTPIIRISNITDPQSAFLKTTELFEGKYKVEIGDLLVSWSASFKSIIWPGPPSILNQHIFRVRERPPNNRNYIRHAIEAVFDEMQQKVVGIGMMHLRRHDFIGHDIPCPSPEIQLAVGEYLDWVESGSEGQEPPLPKLLNEQRRVVSRIEHLSTKIEDARSLRVTASFELGALRKSATDAVLESLKCGAATLGDLLSEDSLNGISQRPDGNRHGVEILRISAGTSREDALVDETDVKYLPVDPKKIERYKLCRNDLLACRFNGNLEYVGRFSLYADSRGAFQVYPDKLIRFRVREADALPQFVRYAMNSALGRQQVEEMCATTAGNLGISARQLKTVEVPIPSVEEQARIVVYLDKLQEKTSTLKGLQWETAAKLDALIPSILSKAFQGEL